MIRALLLITVTVILTSCSSPSLTTVADLVVTR